MKKTLAVIIAILCAVSAISLCSCTTTGPVVEKTETWDTSSDERDGSIDIFDEFFEGTSKNTNMVVTVKSGDKEIFVETLDGTSDFVSYTEGTKTYSFVDGEDYIYAMDADEYRSYWVDETYYGYGYNVYKQTVEMFKMLPDDEGLAFSCAANGESVTGEDGEKSSSASVSFEVKNEAGSIRIDATSKNGLVDKLTYVYIEGEQTQTLEFTFAYGAAAVTIPDLSDWSKQEVIESEPDDEDYGDEEVSGEETEETVGEESEEETAD